jgi:hypothetical protein
MIERGPESDDDLALSALLDGELSIDDAAALRRRLTRDPQLSRRLEELQEVDEGLRGAYGGIAQERLPAQVLGLLPAEHRSRARVPWQVAAGLGLAAGILLTLLVLARVHAPGPPGLLLERGEVERGSALEAALETDPSGRSHPLGRAWSATPRLTFRSVEGAPCRVADLRGERGSMEALACRRDGDWKVALLGPLTDPGSSSGAYRPATGTATSGIDAAVAALASGEPLDRGREAAWISSGWQGTGP